MSSQDDQKLRTEAQFINYLKKSASVQNERLECVATLTKFSRQLRTFIKQKKREKKEKGGNSKKNSLSFKIEFFLKLWRGKGGKEE